MDFANHGTMCVCFGMGPSCWLRSSGLVLWLGFFLAGNLHVSFLHLLYCAVIPYPILYLHIIQPCPVPNGAAGLALLGKICRKSNRRERAIKCFRMSLRLDPFLFTSFQALAELGVKDLDAAAMFGGTVTTPNQNSNLS